MGLSDVASFCEKKNSKYLYEMLSQVYLLWETPVVGLYGHQSPRTPRPTTPNSNELAPFYLEPH